MAKSGKKKRTKTKKRQLKPVLVVLAAVIAVLLLGGTATIGGVLWYYGRDLPDVSDLRENYRPHQITRIETSDGELLGEYFDESETQEGARRIVVPFERMPQILVNAVLAAEDADFYQHEGLDYPGMFRAFLINLREGGIRQGASTITQQVVQSHRIGRERTWTRKIRELLLARRLEQYLTKDEILFLYLNHINFGHARYGVQTASQFYFNCDVDDINLAQAALLAGVPRGPTIYSPRLNPDRALARRNWVLEQMEEKGFITAEELATARSMDLQLASRARIENLAPEIVDQVRRELIRVVGEENAELGGYVVRTTVDSRMQKAARQALRKGLEDIDERHDYRVPIQQRKSQSHQGRVRPGRAYLARVIDTNDSEGTVTLQLGDMRGVIYTKNETRYNPQKLPPSRFAVKGSIARISVQREPQGSRPARFQLELGPQAALVAIEPGTGRIRAIVGGYSPRRGDFNRASQARRQPGSSFKPFVYSLALNTKEYTPATLIADAPEVFDRWRPRNYEEWSYEGHVRLRTALAKSINMVAIKLIRDLGPENVVSYTQTLGIESPLEAVPTLALGSSAVTPLEMAEAYAVFASGGIHAEPRIIEEVRDLDGRSIDLTPLGLQEPQRVMEPAEAYLITSMLQSVVRAGTGSNARVLGDDIAGKTGTSNDAKDAWFVGFAPTMACAVWVGFDEPRPLGRQESGSRAALPIWIQFMREALRNAGRRGFRRPSDITTARIDPESGLLAYEGQENAIMEEFLVDAVPTETAIPPDTADPDTFLMEQTGGDDEEEASGEE